MKFDFVVLGATGIQGKIASRDLLKNGYSVLLCGRDKKRVEHLLKKYKNTGFQYFEAKDIKKTSKIIKNSKASVVINCVEGDWNLNILKACIKAGVNCIDLGSDIPMTKDQLKLGVELKKKGIISITGCGSVPGIGNVMLRRAAQKFDKINYVDVGFCWDSNIKKFVVPFSIQSIIEEFTSEAPYIDHKKVVEVMPMNSIIKCYHRTIGRGKQFNVGHHPEIYTFYRFCRNKGIETVKFYAGFPEHSFQVINTMIELGLGSKEPIKFKGQKIVPIEFLTENLKKIKMPRGYKEKENLWVKIIGKKKGVKKEIFMECLVPTLKGWEDAGCNIDTGMPASIIAQMIKNRKIKEKGSFTPEEIVPTKEFFKELADRKMLIYENGKLIN